LSALSYRDGGKVSVKRIQQDTIPPALSPHQAIPLLRRQIERLEQTVISLSHNSPDIEAWVSTTTDILNQAFGQPNGGLHSKTSEFVYANSGEPVQRIPYGGRVNPHDVQRRYVLKQERRKALLKAYVEQLQDLAPPNVSTGPDQYTFHSEIERVSGALYRDGHYKAAALEAYIRVIHEVKQVSGISDDGDSLMHKAFGCEKQTPAVQFNNLSTEAERDEQRGI
jgi:Protein of unknown function (Hypoth_ymh)